jgi:hypothetical protein
VSPRVAASVGTPCESGRPSHHRRASLACLQRSRSDCAHRIASPSATLHELFMLCFPGRTWAIPRLSADGGRPAPKPLHSWKLPIPQRQVHIRDVTFTRWGQRFESASAYQNVSSSKATSLTTCGLSLLPRTSGQFTCELFIQLFIRCRYSLDLSCYLWLHPREINEFAALRRGHSPPKGEVQRFVVDP